ARTKYAELERVRVRYTEGLPVGVTFGDLLAYFEADRLPRMAPGTQGAYRDSLKPIRTFFIERAGNPALTRVRRAHIIEYLDWRRDARLKGKGPLHNRTLGKDRALLHLLFEVALEREWCEANPVAKVRTERYDDRQYVILTDE